MTIRFLSLVIIFNLLYLTASWSMLPGHVYVERIKNSTVKVIGTVKSVKNIEDKGGDYNSNNWSQLQESVVSVEKSFGKIDPGKNFTILTRAVKEGHSPPPGGTIYFYPEDGNRVYITGNENGYINSYTVLFPELEKALKENSDRIVIGYSSISVKNKSWGMLKDAEKLYSSKKYEETVSKYEEAMEEMKRYTGSLNRFYDNHKMNYINACMKMGMFKKVINFYETVMPFKGNIPDKLLEAYVKTGKKGLGKLYEQKWEQAKIRDKFSREYIGNISGGSMSMIDGYYTEIEKLETLIDYYEKQGNVEKVSKFKLILEKIKSEKKLEEEWLRLNALYLEKSKTDDHEEVLKIARKAIEIAVKRFGEKSNEVAGMENNIAMTHLEQGKLELAEKHLGIAWDIIKIKLPGKHLQKGCMLDTQGVIHWKKGDLQKAESCFLTALENIRPFMGKHMPVHQETLRNLSGLYKDMNLLEKKADIDRILSGEKNERDLFLEENDGMDLFSD